MLKEFILAITLGAILGFGVTGSIFALTRSKPTSPPKITPIATTTVDPEVTLSPKVSNFPTSSPSNPQSSENTLTLTTPLNNSIVSNSKTTLKGKTSPNSVISITTSTKVFNTSSDSNGDFSIDIDLESGANLINLSSIDSNDFQSDIQVLVTYSTAKI